MCATRGQIRWWKVESGQHLVQVTAKGDSLIPRYFTQLKDGSFAANNGWIQDYDALQNFAEDGQHHYFKRSIVIWGDLVKLRYGQSKKDSPALWERMKNYVQSLATLFHGLRLDNAHSTPLHVGEYMMRKARQANRDILIFAELFAGSPLKDSIFIKRLGLNTLVRETNRCDSAGKLNGDLHIYSGNGDNAIGSLPTIIEYFSDPNVPYKLLQAQNTPALVYEQTHDNETLIESHGHKHQLPILASISIKNPNNYFQGFSNCSRGTMRGYDLYYQKRLSVVSERRIYDIPPNIRPFEVEQVIIPVQFRLDVQSEGTSVVEVRGSWNEWNTGIPLSLVENSSITTKIYVGSLPLPPGEYEFKFTLDGQWQAPSDKQYNENGNHVLKVSAEKQIIHGSLEPIRKQFTELQQELQEDYPQIFISNHYNSLLQIVRSSKNRLRSKCLIAQPNFSTHYPYVNYKIINLKPVIELPGEIDYIHGIYINDDQIHFASDQNKLFPSDAKVQQFGNILQFADIYYNYQTRSHILKFTQMPKSFVAVLSCKTESGFEQNLKELDQIVKDLRSQQVFDKVFSKLTTNDLNFLLFSCDSEEQDRAKQGLYSVPNYRPLIYAGFAGPLSAVREASRYNNLGHPVLDNLRQGNWLLDYLNDRLSKNTSETFKPVIEFVDKLTELLKNIPKQFIPFYFTEYIESINYQAQKRITNRENSFSMIKKAPFLRQLAVASYQFAAILPSCQFGGFQYSMSAGLPHFTTGWARSWGRDTFIAYRGTYLINGLFAEAREAILQFGSCLRHGLIPNLLDSGRNSRFNCRDACWWYIKAIKDYIEFTSDVKIFKQEVQMQFLDDDLENHVKKRANNEHLVMRVEEIVQSIFQKHAVGIKFREWKAGYQIDEQMDSEGFNIDISLDEATGFLVGGNWRNCLTWMDKMGSSAKAGNKGIPASSRDGAPIELTALLKVCLDFVAKQNELKNYPYEGVTLKNNKSLRFKDWSTFIKNNFEKHYWVPKEDEKFKEYNIVEKHVRHRQIYKDLAKSSKPRNDYQLRCNAYIAIAVAPELFNRQHAILHLANSEGKLIERYSLGVKTLDSIATEYLPYYDNADDSTDMKVAHGFSYHNGPEWVWLYGYFLKAVVTIYGKDYVNKHNFFSYLVNHKHYISENEWFSLPEITNSNGGYNQFSCRAQAWSISCILEAVYDFYQLA